MKQITQLVVLSCLVSPTALHAQQLSLLVSVDTSALVGNNSGPFSLDFQFNDGSGIGAANNTAAVSAIAFGGGGWVEPMSLSNASGGVAVDAASGVITLTNSSLLNEYLQRFMPGSNLSFHIELTARPTSGGIPNQFSFAILDGSLSEIPTEGAGDAFVAVVPDPINPVVQTFQTDLRRTGINMNAPQAILKFTPPPVLQFGGFTNGHFTLTLQNPSPGSTVTIEASVDLSHWTPVHTDTSSSVSFAEPATEAKRFYRARVSP